MTSSLTPRKRVANCVTAVQRLLRYGAATLSSLNESGGMRLNVALLTAQVGVQMTLTRSVDTYNHGPGHMCTMYLMRKTVERLC